MTSNVLGAKPENLWELFPVKKKKKEKKRKKEKKTNPASPPFSREVISRRYTVTEITKV